MVGVLVAFVAVLAVIAMLNWLRTGGGYDEKTVHRIGPEPPGWEPKDVEPWEESPPLYEKKPPRAP
jgi:hypothetical protein